MSQRVIKTFYDVQNKPRGATEWIPKAALNAQEQAEEWLHCAGPWEGCPLRITSQNPNWRIVEHKTVEHSKIVTRVISVMDTDGLVVPS